MNILFIILFLAAAVILLRPVTEKSSGDKSGVREYITNNKDSLSKLPFIVYGEFKKLTSDESVLHEVLMAAKSGDDKKLLKILDGL